MVRKRGRPATDRAARVASRFVRVCPGRTGAGQAVVPEPGRLRARAIPFRTGTAPCPWPLRWGPRGGRGDPGARSSSRSDVRNSRAAFRSDSSISGRVGVCMGSSGQSTTGQGEAPGHVAPGTRGIEQAQARRHDTRLDRGRQASGGPEVRFPSIPRRGRGILGGQRRGREVVARREVVSHTDGFVNLGRTREDYRLFAGANPCFSRRAADFSAPAGRMSCLFRPREENSGRDCPRASLARELGTPRSSAGGAPDSRRPAAVRWCRPVERDRRRDGPGRCTTCSRTRSIAPST